MIRCDSPTLRQLLARTCLPGRAAQARGASELSYGRHSGPPDVDAQLAAVLVLLYPTDHGWHIPLTVRPDSLRQHAGQVCLPGGRCRRQESPAAAAVREVEEELGVAQDVFQLIAPLSPLFLFNSNHLVQPWVGAANSRPDFRSNEAEVARLIELPIAVLLDDSSRGRCEIARGPIRFSAPCFWYAGTPIWGATAMILFELRELLESCS